MREEGGGRREEGGGWRGEEQRETCKKVHASGIPTLTHSNFAQAPVFSTYLHEKHTGSLEKNTRIHLKKTRIHLIVHVHVQQTHGCVYNHTDTRDANQLEGVKTRANK